MLYDFTGKFIFLYTALTYTGLFKRNFCVKILGALLREKCQIQQPHATVIDLFNHIKCMAC